jgi:phosphoribosyl 1,2-cyclic phosphodiesterase
MLFSFAQPSKIQEDVQRYVRTKRLDALISNIVEEIIKYRPNYIGTYIFDYIVKKFPEDAKQAMTGRVLYDLSTKSVK